MLDLLNASLNQTLTKGLGGITFDQAYAVTSSPAFIIPLAIAWFTCIVIYLIWGACASARTSDGRKLESKAISNANFWIAFVIFGLILPALLILIVFPIYLIPFS